MVYYNAYYISIKDIKKFIVKHLSGYTDDKIYQYYYRNEEQCIQQTNEVIQYLKDYIIYMDYDPQDTENPFDGFIYYEKHNDPAIPVFCDLVLNAHKIPLKTLVFNDNFIYYHTPTINNVSSMCYVSFIGEEPDKWRNEEECINLDNILTRENNLNIIEGLK